MNEPLDVRAAAAFLKVKPGTIYNLVFYGELKAYKPGGKKLLFKMTDLEAYAFKKQRGGRQETAEKILNKKAG